MHNVALSQPHFLIAKKRKSTPLPKSFLRLELYEPPKKKKKKSDQCRIFESYRSVSDASFTGWIDKVLFKSGFVARFDLLVASDVSLMSPPSLSLLCLVSPSFHPPCHLRICVFDTQQARFPSRGASCSSKYITLLLWLSQGGLGPCEKCRSGRKTKQKELEEEIVKTGQ